MCGLVADVGWRESTVCYQGARRRWMHLCHAVYTSQPPVSNETLLHWAEQIGSAGHDDGSPSDVSQRSVRSVLAKILATIASCTGAIVSVSARHPAVKRHPDRGARMYNPSLPVRIERERERRGRRKAACCAGRSLPIAFVAVVVSRDSVPEAERTTSSSTSRDRRDSDGSRVPFLAAIAVRASSEAARPNQSIFHIA